MKKLILILVASLVIAVSIFFFSKKINKNTNDTLENEISESPTSYTCPEEGYINCMPIVYDPDNLEDVKKKELRNFKCSNEYLDWAEENCPSFEIVY